MEEILDDYHIDTVKKTPLVKHTFVGALVYLIGLFFIYFICLFLPKNIFEYGGAKVFTSSFIAMIFLIIYAKVWIGYLNKKMPYYSRLKLILIIMTSIFIGDFMFRNFQILSPGKSTINNITINTYALSVVLSALLNSIIGSLLSWSRLNKLRNKRVLVPYLVIFALIALLLAII